MTVPLQNVLLMDEKNAMVQRRRRENEKNAGPDPAEREVTQGC